MTNLPVFVPGEELIFRNSRRAIAKLIFYAFLAALMGGGLLALELLGPTERLTLCGSRFLFLVLVNPCAALMLGMGLFVLICEMRAWGKEPEVLLRAGRDSLWFRGFEIPKKEIVSIQLWLFGGEPFVGIDVTEPFFRKIQSEFQWKGRICRGFNASVGAPHFPLSVATTSYRPTDVVTVLNQWLECNSEKNQLS